jgi:hypothetical protein
MGFYPVTVVLQYDTTHKNTHITQNNTRSRVADGALTSGQAGRLTVEVR